jgi:dienelactone hydrolase
MRRRSLARLGATVLLPALLGPGTALPGAAQEGGEGSYPPAVGRGRVVMVISGESGSELYRFYAAELAKLGYYAVVLDGRDILNADRQGGHRLYQAMQRAWQDPRAAPGKAAVIGFSRGGGGALAYATRMPRSVAVVIAWYPATNFIERRTDMMSFVGAMKVPVLAFAGDLDTFRDCCRIETVRAMAADARQLGRPFDLVEYPDAKHDFDSSTTGARAVDPGRGFDPHAAADAWQRTKDTLRQYLGG